MSSESVHLLIVLIRKTIYFETTLLAKVILSYSKIIGHKMSGHSEATRGINLMHFSKRGSRKFKMDVFEVHVILLYKWHEI